MNPYKFTDWGIDSYLDLHSMFTIDVKELPHVIMGFSRTPLGPHIIMNGFGAGTVYYPAHSDNYSMVLTTPRANSPTWEEPIKIEIIQSKSKMSLCYNNIEGYKNLWNKKTI